MTPGLRSASKTNILTHAHIWVERTRGIAVLLQWESAADTWRRQEKRPNASGVVLDGQVVVNDACRRWFGAQMQMPWAAQ